MPFVQLDALPHLTDNIPFWSARRWAPAAFRRADFLGDSQTSLVDAVKSCIEKQCGAQ